MDSSGTGVYLPTPRCLHKLRNHSGAIKTPVTPLKEVQASVAEVGETVHTTAIGFVLHQSKFYGK